MAGAGGSAASLWAGLSGADRRAILEKYGADTVVRAVTGAGLLRAAQVPPAGDWSIWVILAGRGFGKTRAGAEWVHELALAAPRRFALVAPSLEVARSVMVEGESGLLARAPAAAELEWRVSRNRLDWANGSRALLFSGAVPDALRGGQFDYGWGDEFAHWPQAEASLANLRLATRLGAHPQLLLTTTPLPLAWLKRLLEEPGVVVTRGTMRDNGANLPPGFLQALQARFGGTALGRQEMDGELLEGLEGALWTRAGLEAVRAAGPVPALSRVVVGVDPPAGGAGSTCGIVVAGLVAGSGDAGTAWVLEDASLEGEGPEAWARAVVAAADRHGADRVVAEVNNGGDMVTALLRSVAADLPVEPVRAARGKVARAEPVASLYAGGRVLHGAPFPALEDQLCGLMLDGRYLGPGRSPDRADALVWAIWALLLGRRMPRPGVRGL